MKGRLAFLDQWYERIKATAGDKRAEPVLAGYSFIESSIFPVPIPPEALLIPMVQADHSRAWRIAFICSLFSVLGGIFGYFLGLFFFEVLAEPYLEKIGKAEKMESFSATIREYGALGVFGAGFTPFPYKVITIMSGALKINFAIFVAASVLSRSLRFFLVAGIVKKFGDTAEYWLKEHFGKFTFAIFAVLVALFLIWKFAFGH